jgi:hypothetical protein
MHETAKCTAIRQVAAMNETELLVECARIEALFARGATAGERAAPDAVF